ncbi:MAG: hypothetical protein EPN48_00055 [Microbacteriaceae bacterium]|nr:MAG: hypothetical protein EPN48_00055 [Microbacteriaceae bacterium]
MSRFKVNPAAFAEAGAVVTVHGRPKMILTPVGHADAPNLDSIKGQLKLLAQLQEPQEIEQELERLSRTRDQDVVGKAQ